LPVSVLLCEGEESSFDVLLLRSILQGIFLEVKPSGGKYGLGERVKARRENARSTTTYAIRDRDYDPREEWKLGSSDALRWTIDNGKTHLGWYWRRTDIESYLMSPEVVEVALEGTNFVPTYRPAYNQAIHDILPYVACRSALGHHRKRFTPLPNKFGQPRKPFNGHEFPENFEPSVLLENLESTVNHYNLDIAILGNAVVETQHEYAALFASGEWAQSRIEWISGKDLALYMSPWITSNGFSSPRSFLEQVSKRLKNSRVDTWTLLPEWGALRQQIEKTK